MERQRRAALVYAGPARRSSLNRLPGLASQLAFIKSSSVATASRAVSALRAGVPVRTYEDLSSADLIIVSVPDAALPRINRELASSKMDWKNRTVVLFDSEYDSSSLSSLKSRGAAVASLNWTSNPERFVAEGNSAALRRLRTVILDKPAIILESKAEYLRGMRAATTDFYPVFASTIQLFRSAGMEKAAAEQTAASLFSESIRSWLRAGRRLLRTPPKRPA